MSWNDDFNDGPWGRNRGPRKHNDPKDIDDMLRKGQENFKKYMPKFPNGTSGGGWGFRIALAIVGLWLLTGVYYVQDQEGEQAAVLRFGEFVRVESPGIHYHLPYPIESIEIAKVSAINIVQSGVEIATKRLLRNEDSANLMITGDENIIKLRFTVQWYISDLKDFLFNDPMPRETVRLAAESAVREVIAQTTLASALTTGKDKIIQDSKVLLQKMLDEYKIGIKVVKVNLEEVNPPGSVIESFRDVQRARADRERKINEANAYRNSIIPVARGEAQKIIQGAEAEKQALLDQSSGAAQRFLSVLKEYKQAPDVTLKRMRIENAESVLTGMPKYVIDSKASQGMLPYLPLGESKTKAETVKEK